MPASPATQLAGFIARFSPGIAAHLKALRTKMRRRLPHAHEVVYNYNHALVINYGPSDRPYEAVCALAAQASGISLYLSTKLPDPKKLLSGSGKQVRSLELPDTATLDQPDVEALIAAAIKQAPIPFDPMLRPSLIIKSNSAKQHALRPATRVARHSKTATRKSKI
jgi:hypothetical protein